MGRIEMLRGPHATRGQQKLPTPDLDDAVPQPVCSDISPSVLRYSEFKIISTHVATVHKV
jgi:hypothetical protein